MRAPGQIGRTSGRRSPLRLWASCTVATPKACKRSITGRSARRMFVRTMFAMWHLERGVGNSPPCAGQLPPGCVRPLASSLRRGRKSRLPGGGGSRLTSARQVTRTSSADPHVDVPVLVVIERQPVLQRLMLVERLFVGPDRVLQLPSIAAALRRQTEIVRSALEGALARRRGALELGHADIVAREVIPRRAA